MKLLLDTCISPKTREELEGAGHDVVWAGDWAEDPGDEAILDVAQREGRVLVTLDKDYGELAVLRGRQHCGILRVVNFRASQQGTVCVQILASHAEDLQFGAIVTAEPNRIRIRLSPNPQD